MTKPSIAFETRRQAVFDAMADNSIAFLSAQSVVTRNNDTEYPYRQCSYFHYLTGWPEPNALAVLFKTGGKGRTIMFCQPKDPAKEKWTGRRQGPQGALEHFKVDEAYPLEVLTEKIVPWLTQVNTIYYLFNLHPQVENHIRSWLESLKKHVRQGVSSPHALKDLRVIVDACRLIKSSEEQQLIQKACDISSAAHQEAMLKCRPGMWEYEIEATLLYEFYRQGSHFPAYPSIVAGGENACILHYVQNADRLKNNDLLLIDAGAEFEGYASDITRTFPVNGRFTKTQQAVYECVLAAQMAAIDVVKPGVPWSIMQETILKVMVTGLVDLKVLQGDVSTLIEEKAYAPFYMHNSGHWMGLDVHDVGDYKTPAGDWCPLASGMVMTIEPGLYFDPQDPKVPESLKGIGIRIEDDILVTEKGCRVLSEVPKTVSEIEALMQRGSVV